ncbi:hypothetical protein E1B28_002924 [Marasmius oreades]|uniref:F-box domain-containing protein n=1 Tax=Marasmius oreades TaxID=181124 RepID=A0A9P7RLG7_9AGAR|nr:uncharacterized protein E1B28_002924 [Marasmius oreades]KAG7085360.1 hypothetical protein E1B28_002924 [Marasmius oreades]
MDCWMDLDLGAGTTLTRHIPEELIDKMLNLLWDDQEALKQCSLVSRSFLCTCQKLSFECIRLEEIPDDVDDWAGHILRDSRPTMAERLELLLKSSPHLALLIKDLHIVDQSDLCTWGSWLTDDESLPFILPLLVNLERFYIASGMKDPDYIYLTHLPKPVQEAFFATWRLPKLTHIAIARITFGSFKDVLLVISQSSHSVRNIALCMVDGEEDREVNGNHDRDINGQLIIPRPSSTRHIDSLTFTSFGEHFTEFYTWLLSPETKFVWSSLHKLHFYIRGEFTFQEDLSVFRRILTASPSVEELHVVMYELFRFEGRNTWTESGPQEPIDISSIRVLHLVTDLFGSGLSILDWWCDNLASAPSLALEDLEIYVFPAYSCRPAAALDLIRRLDKILSSTERDINLKIRILPTRNDNLCLVPEDLRHCFTGLRAKGRLEVDCVDDDGLKAYTGYEEDI